VAKYLFLSLVDQDNNRQILDPLKLDESELMNGRINS